MAKVLLDTSILIDFLRRKDREQSILVDLTKDDNQLIISIVTYAELYAGKKVWEKKEAMDELESLFSGLTIMDQSREISKKAGQLKANLGLNLFDAIIAATALAGNCRLATLNVKDFEKVENLKLL